MIQSVLLFVGCPHSCTQLCSAISGEGVKTSHSTRSHQLPGPAGPFDRDGTRSEVDGWRLVFVQVPRMGTKGAGSKGPICNL